MLHFTWFANTIFWCLYGAGILFALLGLMQVIFPLPFWLLSRWMFRSVGVTTDEKPAAGALSAIRVRGAIWLVFSLINLAVVYFISRLFWQFNAHLDEASKMVDSLRGAGWPG